MYAVLRERKKRDYWSDILVARKCVTRKNLPSRFTSQIFQGAIPDRLIIKDTKHARTASSQQSAPRTCFEQRNFNALDLRLYLKDHRFKIISQTLAGGPLRAVGGNLLR
jgi:hypothetical protein